MPELPEVETIKRDLVEKIFNKRIINIFVLDPRVIRNTDPKVFIQHCINKTISEISRQGKAIVIGFREKGYLVIQPMMTGQLICHNGRRDEGLEKATKIIFELSNDLYLNYNDQRLFGRIHFVKKLKEIAYFQTIGPDPLGPKFNFPWLKEALQKHKAPIKSLLMHQNFLAGIGNIYASEILFRSHIAPQRLANSLRQGEIRSLYKAIKNVLSEAIKSRGTSMRNYRDTDGKKGNFIHRIRVYGRENQRCPCCKTPITRIVLSGRSTFYCHQCQT